MCVRRCAGFPVYGRASKTCMHRVQKVLNFCARLISGRRKYDHISDVLSQLGWLSAQNLCTYRCICLLRQALDTGEPATIAQSITTTGQVHDRNTRANEKQLSRLPSIRTETSRRQFSYRAATSYNSLPLPVREGSKRLLKRHLMCL